MKKIPRFAVAVFPFSLFGHALAMQPTPDYRIKLTKDIGGLDIVIHTFVGSAVTVGLENRSGKTVLCSASFVSYPHTPTRDETRSATVAPGRHAALGYPADKLGGEFSTAFVDVKCTGKQ